jgi:hypothetical protein
VSLLAVLVEVELRRTMALFYSLLFAGSRCSAGYGQKQLRCSKRKCDASREGDDGCTQEECGTAQVLSSRQGLKCSLFKACSRSTTQQERLVVGSRMTCESAAGIHVWSKRGGWAERLVTPNLQLLRLFGIVSVRINDRGQEMYLESLRHWAIIAPLISVQFVWSWMPLPFHPGCGSCLG